MNNVFVYCEIEGTQVQEVSKGSAAAEPAVPVREGYTFAGWYADQDYTHLYDFTTPVTEDISVPTISV